MSETDSSPAKVSDLHYCDKTVTLFCFQPGEGGGGGALNSLRNFRLQKKKFTAGTFDSDTSVDQSQSQGNGETEADSPVKMPGGKRVLSDSSPSMDSSQVRLATPIPVISHKYFTLSEWQQLCAEFPGGQAGPQANQDTERLRVRGQPCQAGSPACRRH